MTRARIFMALAWLALAIGLAAVVVSAKPGGGSLMGLFMVDHFLVLFIVFAATWVLRRARRSAEPFRWPGARRLFAPWLMVTAGVAVLVMTFFSALMPVDLFLPAEAHFRMVTVHGGAARADATFAMFAHVWVIFALVGLGLWHVIGLRDAQAPLPEPAIGGASSSQEQPGADARLAPWRRVLIAAVWVLGLAWSVGAMVMFLPRQLCTAPIPWPFALVPLVFFPLSGLFAKRAPYDVPWFAEIVDSRFGAGAWSRFLVSLKPLLLIAVGGLCAGAVLFQTCAADGAAFPFISVFMASGGIGFLLLHVVLRLRKMDGA